jgi:hypothetical protein
MLSRPHDDLSFESISIMTPDRARPLLLIAFVVLMVLGNVFGLGVALVTPERLRGPHPLLGDVWWLYLACPPLALAGLWGVWSWQRWGVALLVLSGVLAFAIELWAVGVGLRLSRIPVSLLWLVLAIWPVWKHFK